MGSLPLDDRENPNPFLMRFLRPLERPVAVIEYDPLVQVNVLVGHAVPAVQAGLDVKTIGVDAED